MENSMKKWTFLALALTSSFAFADAGQIGAVNFGTCIANSKLGKKEQENMEALRKQMTSLMEKTDKELKELAAKFEDTEFLDSLSPKAEEEMKLKYQTLQEDLSRYQNQFYQMMQHAQYQLMQKMHGEIAKVSEKIADTQEMKLDYILNKEACFYIRPNLDVTEAVIAELDKAFDAQASNEPTNEAKKAG